jgi:hypothetical protein
LPRESKNAIEPAIGADSVGSSRIQLEGSAQALNQRVVGSNPTRGTSFKAASGANPEAVCISSVSCQNGQCTNSSTSLVGIWGLECPFEILCHLRKCGRGKVINRVGAIAFTLGGE